MTDSQLHMHRARPTSFDAGARSASSLSLRTFGWFQSFATAPGRIKEFVRYGGASAVSLAFDTTVYMLILHLGLLTPAFAGAAAYSTGLLLSYMISVRFIFDAAGTGKSRRRLIAEYIASGLLGVALTAILIGFLTGILAIPPLAAKLITVGIVFVAIYVVRSAGVFAQSPEAAPVQPG